MSNVEYINPPGLHEPMDGMYSHISVTDATRFVRICGQVPVDEAARSIGVGDLEQQIRSCYEQVSRALESQRLSWGDVTHLNVYTTAIDRYVPLEKEIGPNFFGNHPPPSTLVEVSRLVEPEWMVEIQADAAAG